MGPGFTRLKFMQLCVLGGVEVWALRKRTGEQVTGASCQSKRGVLKLEYYQLHGKST